MDESPRRVGSESGANDAFRRSREGRRATAMSNPAGRTNSKKSPFWGFFSLPDTVSLSVMLDDETVPFLSQAVSVGKVSVFKII